MVITLLSGSHCTLNKEMEKKKVSLSKDPVAPILAYKHYVAIERRLGKLMRFILECFEQKSVERILITEFHNTNVPEANVEEEERSEEDTGDKKDDKQN
ncbi:hypothetical protein Y032_0479g2208 [Ancylostoma ceylanicum]|uniref:FAM20 C-terminal domain-containing protein n=1 Tax=Ancylostoma ceylanicum TaxID=53326 RepID=A0A016WX25_9BILA|nr:hypothetical protein Y032_0479g2208 [Ancylostoma ceylanicum]